MFLTDLLTVEIPVGGFQADPVLVLIMLCDSEISTMTHQRIPAIDGLRALAVVAVILFHLRPAWLPGGFVGVDVFFAISGYVVCKSLLGSKPEKFSRFISNFYARRIIRICPVLIVVLLVSGVISRMFIPEAFVSESIYKTGLTAFFGFSNFQQINADQGYFTSSAEYNPFIHTWSLAVEEQFYFVFPVILFLFLKARWHGSIRSLPILPALVIFSFLYCIWETLHSPDSAYFLLPSRFWELGCGALLCVFHEKRRIMPKTPVHKSIHGAAGFLMILLAMVFADSGRFPFPWAIMPVMGTLLMISSFVGPAGVVPMERFFGHAWMTYIGRISYSLYLWHWPIIVFMRWTTGIETVPQMIAATVATISASVISYHVIEKLTQKSGTFVRKSKVSLSGPSSDGRKEHQHLASLSGNAVIIMMAFVLIGGSSYLFSKINKNKRLPQSVSMKSLPNGDNWSNFGYGINARKLKEGTKATPLGERSVFVVGDSHASGYRGALSLLHHEKGAGVYFCSVGGCRVGSLMLPQRDIDRELEKEVMSDLEKFSKPGDVVFLSSIRALKFCSQQTLLDVDQVVKERDSEEQEKFRQLAVREALTLINKLHAMGLVVVLEAPKPLFLSAPFRCSDWFNRSNPAGERGFTIERKFFEEHRAPGMKSIREVCGMLPSVRVWDPLNVLFEGDTFSAYENGQALYYDGDHLSCHGSYKLYPKFAEMLEEIW